MKCSVTFSNKVSWSTAWFPTLKEGRAAGVKYVKSWYRPGRGELYRRLDANTPTIQHIAGGTLCIANITPIK